MIKLIACAAAALALAACASGADLKADVNGLVGQPVQTAIDRLGPPSAQTDDGDSGKTYIWESNYEVQYSTSQPPNSEGLVDPNNMATDTTPGAASQSSAPANYRCFVRLTAGADGMIKTTAWGGNGDGCAAYAARLNR